jgi:hypothetical protein
MNRPIIAMTASINMSIINPNKLSCGLAVGAIFRRTKILTPIKNNVRIGRLYQVLCRVRGIFINLDCDRAIREFYLTLVRQTKTCAP